jgi:hypothetical protein
LPYYPGAALYKRQVCARALLKVVAGVNYPWMQFLFGGYLVNNHVILVPKKEVTAEGASPLQ